MPSARPPRSGSNFLCELLCSTDVLGKPTEYLNPAALSRLGLPDHPCSPLLRIEQALRLGVTANGVYGLKIFDRHVDDVGQLGLFDRLPRLSFVFLTREDLLAQALSLARAEQTQQWRSTRVATGPAVYDAQRIRRCLEELVRAEARWRMFFARNGLNPLRLSYDGLVADPLTAVRSIAKHVAIDGEFDIDLSRVETEVQRDETSGVWRERFLREHRDLRYLDAAPGDDEVR
jgi:LPS sulfotransferase NodH